MKKGTFGIFTGKTYNPGLCGDSFWKRDAYWKYFGPKDIVPSYVATQSPRTTVCIDFFVDTKEEAEEAVREYLRGK